MLQFFTRKNLRRITHPTQKFQRGQNRSGIQRPPEDPEFHRFLWQKIDTLIPPLATLLLCKFQELHWRSLIPVPGCPACRLLRLPSAEFEDLIPVLLKEIQEPRNGSFLRFLTLPRKNCGLHGHAARRCLSCGCDTPMQPPAGRVAPTACGADDSPGS